MRRVVLSDEAVRHFARIPKADRAFINEGVKRYLMMADPEQASRNKFRWRRPSPYAEFELRLGKWRVFYRLQPDVVEIVMLGEKVGNVLLIGGEEFIL